MATSKGGTSGPSAHLKWQELACKDGTPYPQEWRGTRAIWLSIEFELIRKQLGDRPITIGSGYRTEQHNAAVGGVKASQHIQGRALDLYPPEGATVGDLERAVLEVYQFDGGRIRGIGIYPWGVHFDIRPSDRLHRWWGSRADAELIEELRRA